MKATDFLIRSGDLAADRNFYKNFEVSNIDFEAFMKWRRKNRHLYNKQVRKI